MDEALAEIKDKTGIEPGNVLADAVVGMLHELAGIDVQPQAPKPHTPETERQSFRLADHVNDRNVVLAGMIFLREA